MRLIPYKVQEGPIALSPRTTHGIGMSISLGTLTKFAARIRRCVFDPIRLNPVSHRPMFGE
jgi:hypothetical protein